MTDSTSPHDPPNDRRTTSIDPRAADPLHHAGALEYCSWCSAAVPIVWCITKNQARIPIENGVNARGNVEILLPAPGRNVMALAQVHQGPPGTLEEWVPYMPHHATCTRNLKPKK